MRFVLLRLTSVDHRSVAHGTLCSAVGGVSRPANRTLALPDSSQSRGGRAWEARGQLAIGRSAIASTSLSSSKRHADGRTLRRARLHDQRRSRADRREHDRRRRGSAIAAAAMRPPARWAPDHADASGRSRATAATACPHDPALGVTRFRPSRALATNAAAARAAGGDNGSPLIAGASARRSRSLARCQAQNSPVQRRPPVPSARASRWTSRSSARSGPSRTAGSSRSAAAAHLLPVCSSMQTVTSRRPARDDLWDEPPHDVHGALPPGLPSARCSAIGS
jgi:hypothetical protein